jgi:hypothetical protein
MLMHVWATEISVFRNLAICDSLQAMEEHTMDKDEHYIIGLCDEILEATAERQHRFAFLLGDENTRRKRRHLPVDAYYPTKNLVIEYREIQHSAPVALWDKKPTLSGINRAEQRRKHDQRRRDVLSAYGIKLVELDYTLFGKSKKLKRTPDLDRAIIREALNL